VAHLRSLRLKHNLAREATAKHRYPHGEIRKVGSASSHSLLHSPHANGCSVRLCGWIEPLVYPSCKQDPAQLLIVSA
jgi:hypothetical protein